MIPKSNRAEQPGITGNSLRRRGAGFWEFLILLSFLVAVVIISQFYFASKKTPPAPPPVIVQAPPPPPAAPPPAPAAIAPAQPVIAKVRPPAAQSELALAVLPHAPPAMPLCKKLEEQLRIARDANTAAEADLDAAKKASLQRLHQSPDYLQANADVESKRALKDSAAKKLQQDDAAGLDINQDDADLKSASQDWIAAASNLTQIENDALAADPQIIDKQKVVDETSADERRLSDALNAEVRRLVARCTEGEQCPLLAVRLDWQRSILTVELAPAFQSNSGAMADAAMRQMGRILEFAMHKSPFDWDLGLFPVFIDYHGKSAVEFQPEYLRQDVDEADFDAIDRTHFDNLALVKLAGFIWLSPVVDDMQGRSRVSVNIPAQPAAYREGPVAATPGLSETLDALLIGGYTRPDGSDCPITCVCTTHQEPQTSSYTAIIPRRISMPPLYSKTGLPGAILTQPINPLLPPN